MPDREAFSSAQTGKNGPCLRRLVGDVLTARVQQVHEGGSSSESNLRKRLGEEARTRNPSGPAYKAVAIDEFNLKKARAASEDHENEHLHE